MRYVITIGINKYEHLEQLTCCISDAESIERVFRDLFNDDVKIFRLLDQDASRQRIIELFDNLKLEIGDSLFFYFSGHGKNINGIPFLVCVDAGIEDIKEGNNCIRVDEIFTKVIEKGTDLFVFVDACESGIASTVFRSISGSNKMIVNGKCGGVSYFSSSDYNEYSNELKYLEHGLWTKFLIQAFHDKNILISGKLTTDALKEYLNYMVTKYIESEGLDDIQTPQCIINSRRAMVIYDDNESTFINSSALPINYNSYTQVCDYINRGLSDLSDKVVEENENLERLLDRHNKIVLVSNAGGGKTCEMQQLAYKLKNRCCNEIPVLIGLDSWQGEKIDEFVEKYLSGKLGDNHILILDGFDEIEENEMLKFSYAMNVFSSRHVHMKIVISVRANRYKARRTSGDEGIFQDFVEVQLKDLTQRDISNYLIVKNINDRDFYNEVWEKGLHDVIKNPFYVVRLAQLYEKTGHLSSLPETMKSFIEIQLRCDEERYQDIEVDWNTDEVLQNIRVLAFALQCMQKKKLTFEEYRNLQGDVQQKSFKRIGLVTRDLYTWSFVHKNFQEYLAAEYLSALGLERIKDIVTTDPSFLIIRKSWENVLSYLVIINKDQNLIEWLLDVYPESLIRFETDVISCYDKERIFKRIFERCKELNIWLNWIIFDIDVMAHFASNRNSVEYLIKEIEDRSSAKEKSLSNALKMIEKIHCFFGMEDKVRSALYDCCKDKNVRNYEKGGAITALKNKELIRMEDLKELLSIFQNEKDGNIIGAIYTFISEGKCADEAIDYLLETCDSTLRNKENISVRNRLLECLESIKSMESLYKLFDYIGKHDSFEYDLHFSKKCYEIWFDAAIDCYQGGDQKISELIKHIYVNKKYWSNRESREAFIDYLRKTNQSREVVYFCLNERVANPLICIKPLLDNSLVDEIADNYRNGQLQEPVVFEKYVDSIDSQSYRYSELVQIVKDTSGYIIENKKQGAIIEERERKKQDYFN